MVSVRAFGVFVRCRTLPRDALVHVNQVDEQITLDREDPDDAKIQALTWSASPGSEVPPSLCAPSALRVWHEHVCHNTLNCPPLFRVCLCHVHATYLCKIPASLVGGSPPAHACTVRADAWPCTCTCTGNLAPMQFHGVITLQWDTVGRCPTEYRGLVPRHRAPSWNNAADLRDLCSDCCLALMFRHSTLDVEHHGGRRPC